MAGSRTASAVGRATFGVALLLPALVGCGAADTSPSQRAETAIVAGAMVRPLDEFAPTKHELVVLTAARQELTRRCAARNGVTYTDRRAPDLTELRSGERRYGIFDVTQAQRSGYRPADPEVEPATIDDWTPDEAELRVVTGLTSTGGELLPPDRPVDSAGDPLPAGGCLGEASALLDAGHRPDRELVAHVEFQAYRGAESDDRVQDLWREWSRCMSSAGYSYTTPWDPNDRHWLAAEDEEQRRTAVDDVRCRTELDLAGRWRAVEAEHQKSAMASESPRLEAVRRDITDRIARAEAVLAD